MESDHTLIDSIASDVVSMGPMWPQYGLVCGNHISLLLIVLSHDFDQAGQKVHFDWCHIVICTLRLSVQKCVLCYDHCHHAQGAHKQTYNAKTFT